MHTNTQPIGFDLLPMNVMMVMIMLLIMMMIMLLIMMMMMEMMVGWGEFHAMHTNRHRIGLDRRN